MWARVATPSRIFYAFVCACACLCLCVEAPKWQSSFSLLRQGLKWTQGSLTGSPSSRILSSLISWRGKLPCPPGMCIDVRHPNSGRHDHKTNVLPTETPPPHIWSPHTSSSVGVTADSTCGTFLSRLCDFFSLITSLSFGSLVVDTSPRAWVGMFLSDGSGTPSRF